MAAKKKAQIEDWSESDLTITGRFPTNPELQQIPIKEKEPVKQDISLKIVPLLDRAKSLKVTNNSEYLTAAEFLKDIKAMLGEADAAHDPVIAHWRGKHKAALADKKKDTDPITKAEIAVKQLIAVYLREQEQLRLAEENRLRKENEDRIRLQAEQENLKKAEELTAQGDLDGAAEAIDAPVEIPQVPVHVESSVPKVSGISFRVRYVVQSVELLKLVQAVAVGKAPIETLKANDTFLNSQATSFKKVGELFPGVMVQTEDGIAAGKE